MNALSSLDLLAAAAQNGTVFGIPVLWLAIFVGTAVASFMVQSKLKKRFEEYSRDPMPLTGREVAERMLRENGITDVQVTHTPGQLTDHYNPLKKTVNLSEGVYQANSVAAAAIAAHECGHAVQHAQAYHWLKLRSALVPVTNAASKMMNVLMILMFVGMFAMGGSPLPFLIFIGCLAVVTLFSIITLPVEFDASKRAMVWLRSSGLAGTMQQDKAENALFWAAMTYVVAALSSLAMLLYYLMIFLNRR